MSQSDEQTFTEQELEALARLQGKPVSPDLEKKVLDALDREQHQTPTNPEQDTPESDL